MSMWVLRVALAASISTSCATQAPSRKAVAVVAGQTIWEEDLLAAASSQLAQLRSQEYEVKRQALDNLINRRLIEAEARKRGITPDQLFELDADAKVAGPTDQEIEALYAAQKDRLQRPLEEVRPQLAAALKRARIQTAREQFLHSLREKADVAVLLQPPRVEVEYDPARLKGNPKAPVRIVEFSDYQCPFCVRAQLVLKEVLAKYEGRVSLAFRDFPLREIHPRAQSAAEASRCAADQGKFWEYHDALFANHTKLDPASLSEYARNLGLEAKPFDDCLASGRFRAKVEEDVQEGARAGVSGTPAFFINGIFLNGAQPRSAFERIIDAELARNRN